MKLSKKLIINLIEGALFAEGKPMSLDKIKNLLPKEHRLNMGELRALMEEIQNQYQTRGVHLVEVASGFRFQVAPHVTEHLVEQKEEKPMRFSKAFMETLALIAYRQPITRGEIEDIRGVAVNPHMIKTMQELEWIREVGFKDVPGKPALFATSKKFLDFFNLKTLSDLPPLADLEELTETRLQKDFESLDEAIKADFIGPMPPEEEPALEDMDDMDEVVTEEMIETALEDAALEQAERENSEDLSVDQEIQDEALEIESELLSEELEIKEEKDSVNHRPLDEFSEIAITYQEEEEDKKEGTGGNED